MQPTELISVLVSFLRVRAHTAAARSTIKRQVTTLTDVAILWTPSLESGRLSLRGNEKLHLTGATVLSLAKCGYGTPWRRCRQLHSWGR